MPMTRKRGVLVPATVPFWLRPDSTFGLFSVTMFIERVVFQMCTLGQIYAMLRPPSEGGCDGTHSRALPLLSHGARHQGRQDQDWKTALPLSKRGLPSCFLCAQPCLS